MTRRCSSRTRRTSACAPLAAADAQGDGLLWFVLNVEANVEIDITALDAVEELRAELVGRGVVFALARVKQDLLSPLRAYGLADRIGGPALPHPSRCRDRLPGLGTLP